MGREGALVKSYGWSGFSPLPAFEKVAETYVPSAAEMDFALYKQEAVGNRYPMLCAIMHCPSLGALLIQREIALLKLGAPRDFGGWNVTLPVSVSTSQGLGCSLSFTPVCLLHFFFQLFAKSFVHVSGHRILQRRCCYLLRHWASESLHAGLRRRCQVPLSQGGCQRKSSQSVVIRVRDKRHQAPPGFLQKVINDVTEAQERH